MLKGLREWLRKNDTNLHWGYYGFMFVFSKNFQKTLFFSSFILIFSFFSAISLVSAQNQPTFFFTHDLKLGSSGQDVQELQKILNRDLETQIATNGNGSPGLESTYFGQMTLQAVIKFQNKYHDEVLQPVGLSSGNGNVGLWTRLKLNQILINAQVSQTPPETPSGSGEPTTTPPVNPTVPVTLPLIPGSSPSSSGKSLSLSLSSLSQYSGKAGSSLTIGGSGFSLKGNTIHFGSNSFPNIVPKSEGQITFLIPNSLNPGRYDVSVSNSGKTSNSQPFMVTVPGAIAPVITKIEPSTVVFGQNITVTGQNFTKTGNIVSTNLGIFKNISSVNGTTLSFSIPLPTYLENYKKSISWPVKVYVVNVNGISSPNSASQATIKI